MLFRSPKRALQHLRAFPYFPLSSTAPGVNITHSVDRGAVVGLFIYATDANESDIEILTRDPLNRIRYVNQLSDSTDAYLAPGEAWTEWAKSSHRLVPLRLSLVR